MIPCMYVILQLAFSFTIMFLIFIHIDTMQIKFTDFIHCKAFHKMKKPQFIHFCTDEQYRLLPIFHYYEAHYSEQPFHWSPFVCVYEFPEAKSVSYSLQATSSPLCFSSEDFLKTVILNHLHIVHSCFVLQQQRGVVTTMTTEGYVHVQLLGFRQSYQLTLIPVIYLENSITYSRTSHQSSLLHFFFLCIALRNFHPFPWLQQMLLCRWHPTSKHTTPTSLCLSQEHISISNYSLVISTRDFP